MGPLQKQHPGLTGSPLTSPALGSPLMALQEPWPWHRGRAGWHVEQGIAKDEESDVSLGAEAFSR